MKVRIGYGPGLGHPSTQASWFAGFVDSLEEFGFDSLWLPERLAGPSSDPVVGLAFAAGRTTRLKLGTSVLMLPGRNPVVLAKELACLDALSGGRFLPAFGLGVADTTEQSAFGVARNERAAIFDESLALIREIWSGEPVEHDGAHFQVHGFKLASLPVQKPLEVWLGGVAPSELRRVGRVADGWLPSFISPEEAAASRIIVEEAASAADRSIDPEHFGALVPFALGEIPDRFRSFLEQRRPGTDIASVVPSGIGAIKELLGRFVESGFSKFVLVPILPSEDDRKEMELLAAEVLPLQN
jgi:probable F420-dependent oxidoreductase